MRVLVTGAAGFVGKHLVPALERCGHETVGVDREVDVTEANGFETFVRKTLPQGLVHLAGQSSVAASSGAPDLTWHVNYVGGARVLEAVRRAAPSCRVLLIGSGEVYGSAPPGAPPFDEEAPFAPRSPYAHSKACVDRLGAAYAGLGVDVVCVRPFNHTGPGQADHFVAGSFARQAAEIACERRAPHVRVGNLDSVRDFLDVEDVVAAYVALLESDAAGAFNVASGEGVRIGRLLESLLAIAGVEAEIEIDPARHRPADCAVGNAARLAQMTGWRPRVSLQQTLERMYAAIRAELEKS